MDLILGHKIDVVIDTPPQGVEHQKDGFVIRRNAIETGVNVLTSLDTAEALVTSLENTDLHNLTLIDIATIARRQSNKNDLLNGEAAEVSPVLYVAEKKS